MKNRRHSTNLSGNTVPCCSTWIRIMWERYGHNGAAARHCVGSFIAVTRGRDERTTVGCQAVKLTIAWSGTGTGH